MSQSEPTTALPGRRAIRAGEVTVLVDDPIWPAHGRLWAHLVSDADIDELHAFARANDVPARAFDLDHYDVPEEIIPRLSPPVPTM